MWGGISRRSDGGTGGQAEGRPRRTRLPACPPARLPVILLLLACGPGALPAQQPPPTSIEESRRRIEAIRAERERLQQQQSRLQGQVQDVGTELRNLERQRDVTNRLVNEIERQISGLASQLDQTSAELIMSQDNLAERRAVLERRLVDIYKRGPLHTWQVLLAAESFGDLLARYKYLYLTSSQDRALLTDVARLNDRITRQRTQLREVLGQLDNRRTEREAEVRQYATLAGEREARFRFHLPARGTVAVAVYDPAGRLVRRLFRGDLAAGSHDLGWDGRNEAGQSVAPGVFFVRAQSGEAAGSARYVLIR